MSVLCRQTTRKLAQINSLYRKPLHVSSTLESQMARINKLNFSKNSSPEIENSQPVQFTSSAASQWKAEYSRRGAKDDDSPPSQPYIVTGSLAIFLLYFCVLREENDIDFKIGGGGFESTSDYLEYIQLKVIVEQNEKDGVESDMNVLKRLNELKVMQTHLHGHTQ